MLRVAVEIKKRNSTQSNIQYPRSESGHLGSCRVVGKMLAPSCQPLFLSGERDSMNANTVHQQPGSETRFQGAETETLTGNKRRREKDVYKWLQPIYNRNGYNPYTKRFQPGFVLPSSNLHST